MSDGPIRCPAIRSLIHDGKLTHEDLKTASVADLMKALSGGAHPLSPRDPGSLANIAGFFAIFNHRIPRDLHAAAAVGAGGTASGTFDLRLFQSPGDHPGTVDFFTNDEEGRFDAKHFAETMAEVSDGTTLTIDGIARMILEANQRAKPEATVLDLVKSAGEWALMVCALRRPGTTDISVEDLERMYSQRDSSRLLAGTAEATAVDWLTMTMRITAAIARRKRRAIFGLARELHKAFGELRDLCPCVVCNPTLWARR